jgi:hypothetical protein
VKNKNQLNEIRNIYSQLVSLLPESTFGFKISENSKIPFKVEILKGVLLHRISELSKSAIKLIEEADNLQAIILIRAIQESVAILYWLFFEVDVVCSKNEIQDFDRFITRILFGSRIKPRKEEAFNVLKATDKLDKLIPGFRKSYEILSEFAHPNSAGTFISFGKLDKKNNAFHFGAKARNKPVDNGLFALKGALSLALKINKDIENIFSDFVKVCENNVNKNLKGNNRINSEQKRGR